MDYRSLVGYLKADVEALAIEADAFWNCGTSAEDSLLRKASKYLLNADNAASMTIASAIIFRECYLRGIHKT